jgi:hypothetical protein
VIDWNGAVVLADRPRAVALLFVPLPCEGCAAETFDTPAGRAVRLRFDRGEVRMLASPRPEIIENERAAARVRQAAFLTGLAERAVADTREHVMRRRQFGRALLDVQSVAQRLARSAAQSRAAELLVHYAAWRCDTRRGAEPAAAQALAAAAELALSTTRLSIQLHGARGMVADGAPAAAYRIALAEAARLGTASQLWREAGRRTLTSRLTVLAPRPAPSYDRDPEPAGLNS